jgi:ParB family transcriptional regulator, chromosome partitioning protein
MSENNMQQKGPVKTNKGLGRGLGSLLSGEDGAFAKSSPGADKTLKTLAENLPSRSEPALQQGFIETKPAPPAAPTVPNHLRIWQIAIEKIQPNPNQPRQIFAPEPLQELANSIQEKGIIQPLLLHKKGDGFEIIAGERRWRAAQLAGLKDVPAIVKETEDQEVLELALIENIQRENLNAIEEAEAYDFLIKKYNLTQQDLARKVGKDRATVANLLRLLGLEPSVRKMVSKNELSLGQAKVLLSIADGKRQQALAEKAHKETLSVRALEKLLVQTKAPATAELSEDLQLRMMLAKDLGEELQKLVGTKVNLDYDQGKGKISIHFYSDAELNQMADRLRSAWRT